MNLIKGKLLGMKKSLFSHWPASRNSARESLRPYWVRISSGPLQARELFLAPQSPAYWNKEMMEGRYDSFIYSALMEWGKAEASTIWDVGAHIGYHSLAFASLAGPAGRIVAFEPNPCNSERLQVNLGRNPDLAQRISLLDYALSDSEAEAVFHFSSEVDNGKSSGSHLDSAVLPEDKNVYRSFRRGRARSITADAVIKNNLAPPPQVVKIDVEGAELAVLKGSSELLSSGKPILFIEIHNIAMMFGVQKFLCRYGYELTMLQAEHASPSRGFFLARHPGRTTG